MKKTLILFVVILTLSVLFVGCYENDPLTEDLYVGNFDMDTITGDTLEIKHADTHENGGSDEVDVTGLSGLLADEQDPVDHAVDHEWNGGDMLNAASILVSVRQYAFVGWDFAWSRPTTGSGYTGWVLPRMMQLYTGATQNSTCGMLGTDWNYFQYDSDLLCLGFAVSYRVNSAADMREDWIGYFHDYNVYPSNTSVHLGFRMFSDSDGGNSTLYTTVGNGVAYTETSLMTDILSWSDVYLIMLYKYSASAKVTFYASRDALTWYTTDITTNVPHLEAVYYGAWIQNGEAENKGSMFSQTRIFQSSDIEE